MLVAVWAVALPAFWDTVFLGQIYMPLALAVIAAWCLLERGHGSWAGVVIGLLVAIKPNFLVWPVLLCLSGYYKPALAALGTALVLSAIPVGWFGLDIYAQWFELLASDRQRYAFLTNASLAGLAARAGVPALGLALSLAVLAGLAVWAVLRRPPVSTVSSFALVASILASPIGWMHYTLFLLPVLSANWRLPAVRAAVLLMLVPLPVVLTQFDKAPVLQLTVGSLYGWAMVLCLCGLTAAEWNRVRMGDAT